MLIYVYPNKYALIDEEDYNKLNKIKWYFNNGYAINGKHVMHRMVLNYNGNDIIDHINGDKLDNRKSNLRILNRQANAFNRKDTNKNNKLGLNGVYQTKYGYVAQIKLDNKLYNLGTYHDKMDAYNVYKLMKDFVQLFMYKN